MGKSPYKTVLLPIEVPDNDFCWDGHTPCPHFNNEGGYATCDLNIGEITRVKDFVYGKPPDCRALKKI